MKKIALFAGILFTSFSAHATILSQCAEEFCTFQGTVTVDTTSGWFDSSYSRADLEPASSTAGVPPTNRVDLPTFSSPSSDFWVSTHYRVIASTTGLDRAVLVLWDGATPRLAIRQTATAGQIKATKINALGTFTDLATATGSFSSGVLARLDCHVVYAVAGSVDCYNNGVSILTYSGDVTTNSATTLDKAAFGAIGNSVTGWSEMFVADADTRSMRLLTCAPSSAGTTQQWSGALVGNINEVTLNDATANSTLNNNERSNWNLCSLPAGTYVPTNVMSCARVSRGTTSGPQNFRHTLYIGSTNYDNPSDIMPNTSFTNNCYNWGATSPATSGAWTNSEISTMQGGVISKP